MQRPRRAWGKSHSHSSFHFKSLENINNSNGKDTKKAVVSKKPMQAKHKPLRQFHRQKQSIRKPLRTSVIPKRRFDFFFRRFILVNRRLTKFFRRFVEPLGNDNIQKQLKRNFSCSLKSIKNSEQGAKTYFDFNLLSNAIR